MPEDRPSISLSTRTANTFLRSGFHKDDGRNGNKRTAPYWTWIGNVSQSATHWLNNSLQQKADAPTAHKYSISRVSLLSRSFFARLSVHALMQYIHETIDQHVPIPRTRAHTTPVHYRTGGLPSEIRASEEKRRKDKSTRRRTMDGLKKEQMKTKTHTTNTKQYLQKQSIGRTASRDKVMRIVSTVSIMHHVIPEDWYLGN